MTKKERAILMIVLGLLVFAQLVAVPSYFLGIDGIYGWDAFLLAYVIVLSVYVFCAFLAGLIVLAVNWVYRGK